MVSVRSLLNALDERTIAREVTLRHDNARNRYRLNSNTVQGSFSDFEWLLADYFSYHQSQCIAYGGQVSAVGARSAAKEIVEQEYRRRNGNIVTAFNDACDGTNGGMRAILDIIAENLKARDVEWWVRDAFDRHVRPHSWEDQVEIIRQFIQQCGLYLSYSIRADQPERYARNYMELIHSYVHALRSTSGIFRRL